jgi:hypothetical protein
MVAHRCREYLGASNFPDAGVRRSSEHVEDRTMRQRLHFVAVVLVLALFSVAAEKGRNAETVVTASLKSFDKEKPKELKIELENKSGKEITHVRGSITFADKSGKVLFSTGLTADVGKWAADAKSEFQPLYYFQMPPALFNALKDDDKSVVVSFKTAFLKFTDGTEQNY